jgi:hypothetical protein
MKRSPLAGELMYEVDSLFVSTEMILSHEFRQPPLDALLLEACLLHFRVVWDFFYYAKKKKTDVVVRDYIQRWKDIEAPVRLKAIRNWLNAMLAHLTTHRVDPTYKAGEITEQDVRLIREHTKVLFASFVNALTKEQRHALVNPHAEKFAQFETLNR